MSLSGFLRNSTPADVEKCERNRFGTEQRVDHNEHEHDNEVRHSRERASTCARLAGVGLAADAHYFTSMIGDCERAGDMVH